MSNYSRRLEKELHTWDRIHYGEDNKERMNSEAILR